MTEELDKKIREIANYYVSECWGTYLDLSDTDLVSAGIGVALAVTKELQEENEQLKKDLVENKSDCENCYKNADEKIKALEEMIEKMKCCNNCKHRYFMDWKSVCGFDLSEIKDIENPTTCKCNKWEIEG